MAPLRQLADDTGVKFSLFFLIAPFSLFSADYTPNFTLIHTPVPMADHHVDTAEVLKFFASELQKFGDNVAKSIKAYVEDGKELKSSFAASSKKRKGDKVTRDRNFNRKNGCYLVLIQGGLRGAHDLFAR